MHFKFTFLSCIFFTSGSFIVGEHLQPQILPDLSYHVVKDKGHLSLTCYGKTSGVRWQLPQSNGAVNSTKFRIAYTSTSARLEMFGLQYTDTASYRCIHNGSSNYDSPSNHRDVYVYVEDGEHMVTSIRNVVFLKPVETQSVVIPCKPTNPVYNVTLLRNSVDLMTERSVGFGGNSARLYSTRTPSIEYDPKVGFKINGVISELHSGRLVCQVQGWVKSKDSDHVYLWKSHKVVYFLNVIERSADFIPKPQIFRLQASNSQRKFTAVLGDPLLTLKCTVLADRNALIRINWILPDQKFCGKFSSPEAHNTHCYSLREVVDHTETRSYITRSAQVVKIEKVLEIQDVNLHDQGSYICQAWISTGNGWNSVQSSKSVRVIQEPDTKPIFRMNSGGNALSLNVNTDTVTDMETAIVPYWKVEIHSQPVLPLIKWFDPNGDLIDVDNFGFDDEMDKYSISTVKQRDESIFHSTLQIHNPSFENSGTYKIQVSNGNQTLERKFSLTIYKPPSIKAEILEHKELFETEEDINIRCNVTSYPNTPVTTCKFYECEWFENKKCIQIRQSVEALTLVKEKVSSKFEKIFIFKMKTKESGQVVCQACTTKECDSYEVDIYVSDVSNGFGIESNMDDTSGNILIGDEVQLTCSVSLLISESGSISWHKESKDGQTSEKLSAIMKKENDSDYTIIGGSTSLSYFSTLHISDVDEDDAGQYVCKSEVLRNSIINLEPLITSSGQSIELDWTHDGQIIQQSYSIIVSKSSKPEMRDTNLDGGLTQIESASDGMVLRCSFYGIPKPTVEWKFNNRQLESRDGSDGYYITSQTIDRNVIQETLQVKHVYENFQGLYSCLGSNTEGSWKAQQIVRLKSSIANMIQNDAITSHVKSADGEESPMKNFLSTYATSNISLPIILASLIAVLMVVFILVSVKVCFSSRGNNGHKCIRIRGLSSHIKGAREEGQDEHDTVSVENETDIEDKMHWKRSSSLPRSSTKRYDQYIISSSQSSAEDDQIDGKTHHLSNVTASSTTSERRDSTDSEGWYSLQLRRFDTALDRSSLPNSNNNNMYDVNFATTTAATNNNSGACGMYRTDVRATSMRPPKLCSIQENSFDTNTTPMEFGRYSPLPSLSSNAGGKRMDMFPRNFHTTSSMVGTLPHSYSTSAATSHTSSNIPYTDYNTLSLSRRMTSNSTLPKSIHLNGWQSIKDDHLPTVYDSSTLGLPKVQVSMGASADLVKSNYINVGVSSGEQMSAAGGELPPPLFCCDSVKLSSMDVHNNTDQQLEQILQMGERGICHSVDV